MLKKLMLIVALGLSASLLQGCAFSQKGGDCCGACPGQAQECCSEKADGECCGG